MKHPLTVLLPLFLLFSGSLMQKPNLRTHFDSLVEAERNFAKTSVTTSTREAFLANLSDESILFRPHPVQGKKWTLDSPSSTDLLTWKPIFADIAQSGELGFTTGPWEYRVTRTPDEKPVAYGDYVTVWKKQADGNWKIMIDIGIVHAQPTTNLEFQAPPLPEDGSEKGSQAKPAKVDKNALLGLDQELSKTIAAKGIAAGWLSRVANDGRLYRNKSFPFVGKEMISKALYDVKGEISFQPKGGEISSSGDLGYTFGQCEIKTEGKTTEYFNYLHIWKRQSDNSMKIELDLLNPCPPPNAPTTN